MALGDYIALLEHLPKVGALLNRVLPLLEGRFSAQNSAAAEDLRASIDALRSDIGKVTAQQASLYRQLNEQGEQLNAALAEVRSAKSAIDAVDTRLDAIEQRQKTTILVQSLQGIVLLVLLGLLLALFVRH